MKDLSVKKVFSNGLISIAFQGIPILLALVCIPLNIRFLGDTLWGVYSLSITILFLFIYFNIGINPSVNKQLSFFIGEGNRRTEIDKLLSNGFYFNISISIIIGILIYALSPVIVQYAISDKALTKTSIKLFQLASIVGMLSLIISFFRNVFEAMQRFFLVSTLRAVLSSIILIAPTVGHYWNYNIIDSFYIILAIYLIVLLIYSIEYIKIYNLPKIAFLEQKSIKSLLVFGVWITGHTLLNPIYIFMDRFFISSNLGIDAVSFYTTPYDLVSKMTLISGSLTAAFFPAVSYWYAKNDIRNLKKSLTKTLKFLSISLLTISIVMISIAPYFMQIWISEEYMLKSTSVFRILVVGFALSGISLVFLRFIYGIGKPKYAFLLNLSLIPIYLLSLTILVNNYGIEGAAWAFLVKSVLDIIGYSIISKKIIKIL